METDELLLSALMYAELGYRIFPAIPGEKRPLVAHGLKEATSDPVQIEAWWTQSPNANICLSTDGLLVVDVDGSNNPWLTPDRAMELAAAPISRTPSGGWHYIFRQAAGADYRNTQSTIADKVDTRANGGYIVVAPSQLATGGVYRWATDGLEVSPDRLPLPPKWLTDSLAEKTAKVRSELRSGSNPIPSGQRHSALVSMAGAMRRVGMSANEIKAALLQVNSERCNPPCDPEHIVGISERVAKYEPDQAAVAVTEDHWGQLAGHQEEDVPPPPGPVDPGPLPASMLQVPGFISDVMQHNLSGAFKPQPELALASALSLLATLTGRKIADAYGTRTNLYCLGVARTGAGKERGRQVNKEILYLAGLEKMIGPESIGSSAGLVTAVEAQPAILFQLDEIGRLLKTLGDARQSHLYGIATVLMKLYTSSNSIYVGDAYADAKKVKTIIQPHACLYGTTVPQSLYEALTTESMTDGFLSRMMVFEATNHDPEPQSVASSPPGQQIVDIARYWGDLRTGGNLSNEMPQPIIVPYCHGSEAIMQELEMYAREARQGSTETVTAAWTRVVEKARKLALLYACSERPELPSVSPDAVQWASGLAKHLTLSLLHIAEQWISENPFQAKCKRVLRIIRAAGPQGMRAGELLRATRFLQKKERGELIEALLSTGELIQQEEPTTTKTAMRYVATWDK